jgi:hypothetical protein
MTSKKTTIFTHECVINKFGQIRIKKSFLFSVTTRFYRFTKKK